MRQNILHLITSSGWGGAERSAAVLAEAAARDFDVAVMAGASDRQALFQALSDGVVRLPARHLKRRVAPLSDVLAVFEVRRAIDDLGASLLHCHSTKAGLVGALAARLSRRRPKVVYTAHGWAFLERRNPLFVLSVLLSEKLASRFRDATIVLSEKEARAALGLKLADASTLHVIPHGIAASEISFLPKEAARSRLARDEDIEPFLFGAVANAYPAKALPVLLEAFERAAADRPEAGLVIIGDGPEMPRLRDRRERSPAASRIRLLGHVDGAARLLKGFDVFVLPSTKEGMPWAVLEASLAGLPIVATRVGALEEMIEDGSDGLLVPPGDPAALAGAMRRLLEDAGLREKLAAAAPRAAGRFSAEAMVRRTLEVYRSLLSAPER